MHVVQIQLYHPVSERISFVVQIQSLVDGGREGKVSDIDSCGSSVISNITKLDLSSSQHQIPILSITRHQNERTTDGSCSRDYCTDVDHRNHLRMDTTALDLLAGSYFRTISQRCRRQGKCINMSRTPFP